MSSNGVYVIAELSANHGGSKARAGWDAGTETEAQPVRGARGGNAVRGAYRCAPLSCDAACG